MSQCNGQAKILTSQEKYTILPEERGGGEGGYCLHHLFDVDLRLQDELFGICGDMPARVYLHGVSNHRRVVVDMATQFDLHQIPSFQGLLQENPGKGEPLSTTLPQQDTKTRAFLI